MEASLLAVLSSLLGTVAGGGISYLLNRQLHTHQLAALREQYKTEFAAEATARHFLSHKTHIRRSFETLKQFLGGFADNELRKILVRAGAVRTFSKDGTEWWRLLSRTDEWIHKMDARKSDASVS